MMQQAMSMLGGGGGGMGGMPDLSALAGMMGGMGAGGMGGSGLCFDVLSAFMLSLVLLSCALRVCCRSL